MLLTKSKMFIEYILTLLALRVGLDLQPGLLGGVGLRLELLGNCNSFGLTMTYQPQASVLLNSP